LASIPAGGLPFIRMIPRSLPYALLTGLMGLALGACGRAETAADRHAAEMNDQLAGIQADQDKSSKAGRIDTGEDKSTLGAKEATPPASAKSVPPPSPRTVQLGEGEAAGSDDPNDPTQRPDIRVTGTPGAGGSRTTPSRRVRSGDDGSTTTTQSSEKSSALDPEAKRAYDHAISLVNGKKNDQALEALNAFLVKWPDHPYAENAMYWRGEIFFSQGDYLKAAEQFEAVVARFNGRKAPDALLKIGMCHDKLGAPSRANETWARLKRDYPQSDAARKIPKETR
jgi:tol-pal system protein YbgF